MAECNSTAKQFQGIFNKNILEDPDNSPGFFENLKSVKLALQAYLLLKRNLAREIRPYIQILLLLWKYQLSKLAII